jgi:hypothetical protein
MKTRIGFVSNSSTCSFTVIDLRFDHRILPTIITGQTIIDTQKTWTGETEFRRHKEDYYDFGTKLNWALIQAIYIDRRVRMGGTLDEYELEQDYWHHHALSDLEGSVKRVRRVVENALKQKYNVDVQLQIPLVFEEEYYGGDEDEDTLSEINKEWLNPEPITEKTQVYSYIDHGSLYSESPKNLEIFDSDTMLEAFLFGEGSYVASRADDIEPREPMELEEYQRATTDDYHQVMDNHDEQQPDDFQVYKFFKGWHDLINAQKIEYTQDVVLNIDGKDWLFKNASFSLASCKPEEEGVALSVNLKYDFKEPVE